MSSSVPGAEAVSSAVPRPEFRTQRVRTPSSAPQTEKGRRRKQPGMSTSANWPGAVTPDVSPRSLSVGRRG